MRCPKCGEEMTVRRCGLTKIYVCPRCHRKVLETLEEVERK